MVTVRSRWVVGKIFLIKVTVNYTGCEYLDIIKCAIIEEKGKKKKMFKVLWTNHKECYSRLVGTHSRYHANQSAEKYEVWKDLSEDDVEKIICLGDI